MKRDDFRIGIVGCGPRGLTLVESLLATLLRSERTQVEILIWDDSSAPGAGTNYADDCDGTNLLNVPMRDLTIEPRPRIESYSSVMQSFPSWADWAKKHYPELGMNDYAPRVALGRYLHARFDSLLSQRLTGVRLRRIGFKVDDCQAVGGAWAVHSGAATEEVDELHLCVGHQMAAADSETKKYAMSLGGNFLASVYPANQLVDQSRIPERSCVAIRGFGLSCIDAIVALTEGRGGCFTSTSSGLEYRRSGSEPKLLVPYSLDGLTPVPKPHTLELDELFCPDKGVRDVDQRLREAFQECANQDCLAPLIAMVGSIASERANQTKTWSSTELSCECVERFLQDPIDMTLEAEPLDAMSTYLQMAEGIRSPSACYLAGQVWRHLQHRIYRLTHEYAGENSNRGLLNKLFHLDESIKRLSYGPPTQQVSKLLALITARILTCEFLRRPSVDVRNHTLVLRSQDKAVSCNYFVDSVLAGVDASGIDSQLLRNLMNRGLVQPAVDDFGFRTDFEGLFLHGRINCSEIIGADSIHSATSLPNENIWNY